MTSPSFGRAKSTKMNVESMFTTPIAGRASEDVALQIEAAIVDRKITPGDRLPSERELQAAFGTGRGVIREALHVLKHKGLIEVKKGARGGSFVRRVQAAEVSDSLALFLKLNDIRPQALIEFRESIDRTITILAICRASDADKKALLDATVTLSTALRESEPDLEAVWEMDRELNLRLARMTRNPILELIMQAMQLGLSSYDHTLYADPDYRNKTADNWYKTALYINRGEPAKALAYISYHYLMLQSCLDEKVGDANQDKDPFLSETATGTIGKSHLSR